MTQAHVPNLAELGRRMIAGETPGAPVARLIGFVPRRIADGEAIFEMETDERHANPMGTLHGGILCDIVDAAMGMAFASTLAEGESFTTLELKINFLKPVWKTKLTATARVVKRGRTVGLTEAEVRDPEGDLVARSSSTCMVLRGKAAEGR
ncbi:MAG: PaaI family thioesterase [Thermoanaerobaculia bacterium]